STDVENPASAPSDGSVPRVPPNGGGVWGRSGARSPPLLLMPRKLAPDIWLFGVAVVLLSAGVVMVYSASAIVAADRFHDPYFFLKKQIFWALLGAACMWMAIRLDYRRLEGFVLPLLIFAGILLVLVLVSPFGQAINGTRRWIRLGPVSFQPAELAKLALVIYLAAFLAKKGKKISDFKRGLVPPLTIT